MYIEATCAMAHINKEHIAVYTHKCMALYYQQFSDKTVVVKTCRSGLLQYDTRHSNQSSFNSFMPIENAGLAQPDRYIASSFSL